MRPDLDDILSGVQRLLTGDLVPALTGSPFLVEQAMYAALVLDYCRKSLPRVHLELAEEHADLRDTLGRASAHLRDADAELGAEIELALRDASVDVAVTPLDVVAEDNRVLRGLVDRAVALLAEREQDAAAPGSPLALARSEIDAYLVRLAARQGRALATLGLSW